MIHYHFALKSYLKGAEIAKGALVFIGRHEHSHFVFKIYGDGYEYIVDPWMLSRQMFIKMKEYELTISANPACCISGEQISFESIGAPDDSGLFWKISDNSYYYGRRINHIFTKLGIYSVFLYGKSKQGVSCRLQYFTVTGAGVTSPRVTLEAEDRSFAQLHNPYTVTFGETPDMPNVLDIAIIETTKGIFSKTVKLYNNSTLLFVPEDCSIEYSSAFISIDSFDTKNMMCIFKIDTVDLKAHEYLEKIEFKCDMLNGCQTIWMKVNILHKNNDDIIICSCVDKEFWKTGYTFVGHRFVNWYSSKGYKAAYLTNGKGPCKDSKVVFQPVLEAGEYEVGFCKHDKFDCISKIKIIVKHKEGVESIDFIPSENLKIGVFSFDAGNDGKVELLAEKSIGPVVADAIYFKKQVE